MWIGILSLTFTSSPLLKTWTTFVKLQASGSMPLFSDPSRITNAGSVTMSAHSFITLGY